ncbi:MAG: DUF4270 family protein [Bacteroidota bacterium]
MLKQTRNCAAIFALLFFTVFVGCRKDPSDIGLDLIPESERMNVVFCDTSAVIAYTVSEDSLNTNNNSASLVGSYNDPVFGRTYASFLAHLRLSSNNVNFHRSTSTVADSLILYINVAGYFGDGNSKQIIRVYRMNNAISTDSIYYSDINPRNYYDGSGLIGTDVLAPENDTMIKINCSGLMQEFMNADTLNFIDNDAFLEYFKGIVVTTYDPYNEPGGTNSCILYCDLLSSSTKMIMYFHDTVSYSFPFIINDNSERINAFEHDYSSVIFRNNIDNFALEDSVIYLQGMGGVKGKIVFPGITGWRSMANIVIHKAELLINIETNESSAGLYDVPGRLTLRAINDDGTTSLLLDDPANNQYGNYFGGYYDDDEMYYKINITRYFQNLLGGKYSDNGLYLFPYDKRITANRVVVTSGSHTKRMKLMVTYTKL